MFDRAGAELMRPGISQHLRDDLWFVADETFDRLVSDYVLRGVYQKLRPTRLEMEARFTLILEHLITQYHSSNQTPKKVGGLAPYQLRLVQNFLEERIDRDVSLAQLAQIADLSTFHLCRAFKQSTGLPPHRWRMARRIERARDMLETTDLTVMEVAAAVGFDNPSGFASAFRKALGVTPSDYRRQRRF
jgi:AraC family transcriptional regulator